MLSPGHFRLTTGLGAVLFSSTTFANRTRRLIGTGVNFEEAAGLGRELEIGVRFGARLDESGRGLRADEAARGTDMETFGTGLSVAANPELRLRWRALAAPWGEVGFEDRVILPNRPDPNFTELLRALTSIRLGTSARLDVGVEGGVSWISFAAGKAVRPAFGIPGQFWLNVTRPWFIGLITTMHYVAPTQNTTGYARWTAGFGIGYRFGVCDVIESTYVPDVFGASTERIAAGLSFSCRL